MSKKISELTPATEPNPEALFPAVVGGQTLSMTAQQIVDLAMQGTLEVIQEDTTFTVGTGGDFQTLQDAINHVHRKLWHNNTRVTLELIENITLTEPLIFDIFAAGQLVIGSTIRIINLTSVQSTSGSSGNWTYVLNVSDTSILSVGDIIYMTGNPSGGINNGLMRTACKITTINSATRITVLSKNRTTSAPSGAITGSFRAHSHRLTVDGGVLIHRGRIVFNQIQVERTTTGSVIQAGNSLLTQRRAFGNVVLGIDTAVVYNAAGGRVIDAHGITTTVVFQSSAITGGITGLHIDNGSTAYINVAPINGTGTGIVAAGQARVIIIANSFVVACDTGAYAVNMSTIGGSQETAAVFCGTAKNPAAGVVGNFNSYIR